MKAYVTLSMLIAYLLSMGLTEPAIGQNRATDLPQTPEAYLKASGLKSHYDIQNNRVVLYYDSQGKLLAQPGPGETLLTNFDEDDLFEIHIVHTWTQDEEVVYKVDFKPLADRQSWADVLNFIPPALSFAGLSIPTERVMSYLTRGRREDDDPYWTETVEVQGPFEAGTYALEIYNVDTIEERSTKLEINQFRVNALDRFGVKLGVAVSLLTDPEYKVARLKGTPYDTIVSTSGPVRGIPTLSVVVYDWFLHRGRRDKTKAFGGVFPTVGVGLRNPQENFFVGLTWEVSNIVDLNAGAHFGRAAQLHEEFDLGKDVLWEDSTLVNRSDNTIGFSQEWQVNGYFGATIDVGLLLKFLLK